MRSIYRKKQLGSQNQAAHREGARKIDYTSLKKAAQAPCQLTAFAP